MKAISPVAIVFSAAGASMMNGSQRWPAKTRTPFTAAADSSCTRTATVSPAGVVHVPSWSMLWPFSVSAAGEKTQSNTNSSSAAANGAPVVDGLSGRRRNR